MSEVKTNKITSLASNNDITLEPDGTGVVNLADDNKLTFGTGSDLEIFHDGSNSNISDVGTGQLVLRTDGTQVAINKGSSENMAKFIADGAVELYHDNTLKFQTHASGATVGNTSSSGANNGLLIINNGGTGDAMLRFDYENNGDRARIGTSTSGQQLEFYTAGDNERMRIDSTGSILLGGDINTSLTNDGSAFVISGGHHYLKIANDTSSSSNSTMYMNRIQSDGDLISFRHENTTEGKISVGGTTVTYAGGHLARWSRLSDNSKPTTLLKGTVMTNLDEMLVWTGEDNEQHNHTAISSVEGDANVAGLFVSWDCEDGYNDYFLAMTGDMVIRIAQGTTVARGDLLMSAGDGTAKPQDDDIVRSKTIAKVTSTTKSHTYDDGSYLVPCVLMAC